MRTIFFVLISLFFVVTGCLDDKGNYDYIEVNKVRIRFDAYSVSAIQGDKVEIKPKIYYADSTDTLRFVYEWRVDGKFVTNDRVLVFVSNEIGSYQSLFTLIDTITGIRQFESSVSINVTSPYNQGWSILYEKEGKPCLAQITEKTEGSSIVYKLYDEVYRSVNAGEELQGTPVDMIEHYSGYTGPELLVMLNGGKGSVELDGKTMKKVIYTSQEFIGGYPSAFVIKDVSYLKYTNVVLDDQGRIYTRYIKKPTGGFHQAAYNPTPVYIEKGSKITQLIHSNFDKTFHLMMYDEKNNRLLIMGSATPSYSGVIDELHYDGEYPEGYAPLNNFGNLKFVYGSSFDQAGNGSCKYACVLQTPEGKYRYQTFTLKYSTSKSTITIPDRDSWMEIPRGEYITSKSKFWRLRDREYLFFTGGVNNDKLCYFDIDRATTNILDDFNGQEIVAIHPKKGNEELGVCLKNGTFKIYDITLEALLKDTPQIVGQKTISGQIVNMIYRYGNYNAILN